MYVKSYSCCCVRNLHHYCLMLLNLYFDFFSFTFRWFCRWISLLTTRPEPRFGKANFALLM